MRKTLLFLTLLSVVAFSQEPVEKTKESGGESRKSRERGVRESVKRDISEALRELREKRFSLRASVSQFFYPELVKNLNLEIDPDRLYTLKIKDRGYVYSTTVEYLKQASNARMEGAGVINEEYAKELIRVLKASGEYLSQVIKGLENVNMGIEDIEDFVKHVDYQKIGELAKNERVEGGCRMWGELYVVACGGCVLDLRMPAGVPELYCQGKGIFTKDSLNGYNVVFTFSKAGSLEKALSKVASYEEYKAFVDVVSSYTKNVARNVSIALAGEIKSKVLENIASGKDIGVAVNMMRKGEDPWRVLKALR